MKRAFSAGAVTVVAMLTAHGCSSDDGQDEVVDAQVAPEAGSSSGASSSGDTQTSSSGHVDTDGSVAPVDASGDDAATLDAETDGAAQEDAGNDCEPITLQAFSSDEGTFFARVQPAVVAGNNYLDIDLVRGGDVTGSHALGSGANASLATCTQCIRLRAGAGSVGAKLFAPSTGTLEIRQVDLDEERIDASLRAVILREVGNDGATPVADGRCLSLASAEVRVP